LPASAHRPVRATSILQENVMRARNRLCLSMLLGASALAVGAAIAAEPSMSAGDCFSAAMKTGDADALSMCYAEDAVLWFPGGPMAKGRKAIRDGFAGFFSEVTITDIAMTPLGQETLGDAQASWGTYAITMEDKATHAVTIERGRYTDVQKKIDGRWLYIVDHPSDDPAAPAE
jgi:uncharacterized protein (TIGR02246 family)